MRVCLWFVLGQGALLGEEFETPSVELNLVACLEALSAATKALIVARLGSATIINKKWTRVCFALKS